jgi:hypothetical protein
MEADTGETADMHETAWSDGALRVDARGVVSRSDVVLERPGRQGHESMPLGNGVLGASVWAEEGFTAQLNRGDLFPDLKSPGWLVIPGLASLTQARDYRGRLDLYDATLRQSGAGMTADAYVHVDRDVFVVEVAGADPEETQTAELRLWFPREPTTHADGGISALAETFADEVSGYSSGVVAALTARARDVSSCVVDERTVRISFRPLPDGSFRVVAGVPFYEGGDVGAAARAAVDGTTTPEAGELAAGHLRWWRDFWDSAGTLKLTSESGDAEYLENLRQLGLYTTAASMRGRFPASHGGVVGLFNFARDHFDWASSDFWHFNLRMQVSANLAADTAEFNHPFFRLYMENMDAIKAWVAEHWPGAKGIGVAETLRYDGRGESMENVQIDSSSPPGWVNRILSTGLEVALEVWRQYRYTNDREFLDAHYPLMRDVALFHLSVAQEEEDGFLHLEHVNALENQWDTSDPAPDLAGMRVIFPLVAALAGERGDQILADRLYEAIPKIPPFRLVRRESAEVIAWSGTDEPSRNFQNPDLETVWPWGLFDDGGDEGSRLALRTFRNRVFPQLYAWGMDATWAARLGLADEVRDLLLQGTQDFQIFPNGFCCYAKGRAAPETKSFYQEWNGVVATSLHEALVQSYDGLIRITPAWPRQWDADAALRIEGGHRVSLQVRDGTVGYVGLEAGSDDKLKVRSPWPRQEIQVIDGSNTRGTPVVKPTSGTIIELPVSEGRAYLLERTECPCSSFAFQVVGGDSAGKVRVMGERKIGVS